MYSDRAYTQRKMLNVENHMIIHFQYNNLQFIPFLIIHLMRYLTIIHLMRYLTIIHSRILRKTLNFENHMILHFDS